MGRRRASWTTLTRESRARENRFAVVAALRAGHVLRVSNRTDVDAGLVHAGLARQLVAVRAARHPENDPARIEWA